jgi:TPR repeat protein
MPARSRHLATLMALGIPALLSLGSAPAQEPAKAAATQSVTVKGKRDGSDPTEFVAAENRVLSRKRASSCNFMSGYSANDDDVVLAYMKDFNISSNAGNVTDLGGVQTETIRENSPLGDAASAQNADRGRTGEESAGVVTDQTSPAVKCGNADRNFAAGVNRIARKDKTLGEGFAAYDRGDYKEALEKFRENYRKLGYDISALMIGKLYLEGKGVPADTAQGVAWLRKVAEARFAPEDRMRFNPKEPGTMSERAEAAMMLAKMYLAGHGVPRDAATARKWYEVASDAGYVPATSALGLGYLSGFAGQRNPSKGVAYLKQSAEAGYVPAMYQLGKLYYAGEEGVGMDQKLAGAWFSAAAKEGHARSLYAAARMYDLGESVAPDQKRAIALYRDAALKGVPEAQNALATYFYQGEQVEKNLETARRLFNAAAMQAQPDGMFNLAVMTERGEGGPKDLPGAYVWFSLAKASGHAGAAAGLKDIAPLLSKDELAKAQAILSPGTARAQ